MRNGWRAPSGTSAGGVSGGPKHSTSVTAIGRWAIPSTSRITPPTPGVGAAEGLDRRRVVVGLGLQRERHVAGEADDPGVADERRFHERRGDLRRCTRAGRRSATVAERPSSVVIRARNVLWAQCSLHVWASVSSSTSVGSRPSASKWAWMTLSSSGSSASARSLADLDQRVERRARGSATTPATRRCRCRRRGTPARSARTTNVRSPGWRRRGARWRRRGRGRRRRRTRSGGRWRRRDTATPSRDAACISVAGRAVGDARQERHLDAGLRGHRPRCRPAATGRPGSRAATRRSTVVEVAFEEDQVGDGDVDRRGRAVCRAARRRI